MSIDLSMSERISQFRTSAGAAATSAMGQKAKYSLRADVFRFTPNNGHAVTVPP
jgi:hypothetical protein